MMLNVYPAVNMFFAWFLKYSLTNAGFLRQMLILSRYLGFKEMSFNIA